MASNDFDLQSCRYLIRFHRSRVFEPLLRLDSEAEVRTVCGFVDRRMGLL